MQVKKVSKPAEAKPPRHRSQAARSSVKASRNMSRTSSDRYSTLSGVARVNSPK
ncbi:hypothetical protein ACXYTM_05530 [Tsukamurella ocularis]